MLGISDEEFKGIVFNILGDLIAKIKNTYKCSFVELGIETLKQNKKKSQITKTREISENYL